MKCDLKVLALILGGIFAVSWVFVLVTEDDYNFPFTLNVNESVRFNDIEVTYLGDFRLIRGDCTAIFLIDGVKNRVWERDIIGYGQVTRIYEDRVLFMLQSGIH